VLKGTVPDARVTVWNTIGQNRGPKRWWNSLDANELAEARGAEAVILNGPRHFLMDSAKGRVGRVRMFAGERLRKVATIPIRTAAELTQTPYTERTIARRNSWSWSKGRRIYKLLAPDGSRYVMQAYSQIRDPELSIGDLRSLGDRLDLPLGWRYRSKRLRRDLVVRARGEATIVQDELLNTYQRLPSARRPAGRRHRVEIDGVTRTVGSPAPGTLIDSGTISGKPFGAGSVTIEVTLSGSAATGPFQIDTRRGLVFGEVEATFVIEGSVITFTGNAKITGGSGAYRWIRGRKLSFVDTNTLDGQNGRFALVGFARY
jgi:hypothetical protein